MKPVKCPVSIDSLSATKGFLFALLGGRNERQSHLALCRRSFEEIRFECPVEGLPAALVNGHLVP